MTLLIAAAIAVFLITIVIVSIINWRQDFVRRLFEWPTFLSLLNTIILFSTFLVVAYYTYETQRMREEVAKQTSLSLVPVLTMVMNPDKTSSALMVKNRGNGPAFNIGLFVYDEDGRFMATSNNEVVMALPVDGQYPFDNLEYVDSISLKQRFEEASHLIDTMPSRGKNLLCIIYCDLNGKRYYTMINARNPKYGQFIEFKEL
jgi:hypothetical protein